MAEEAHDDWQRDALLVEIHGFGLAPSPSTDVEIRRTLTTARNVKPRNRPATPTGTADLHQSSA
jgi:hypothetical protein